MAGTQTSKLTSWCGRRETPIAALRIYRALFMGTGPVRRALHLHGAYGWGGAEAVLARLLRAGRQTSRRVMRLPAIVEGGHAQTEHALIAG
jgi:hypothetical protein